MNGTKFRNIILTGLLRDMVKDYWRGSYKLYTWTYILQMQNVINYRQKTKNISTPQTLRNGQNNESVWGQNKICRFYQDLCMQLIFMIWITHVGFVCFLEKVYLSKREYLFTILFRIKYLEALIVSNFCKNKYIL